MTAAMSRGGNSGSLKNNQAPLVSRASNTAAAMTPKTARVALGRLVT
jgi:hypothetical protein